MEISTLVETASKTLASNKSEMKALLSQWKALAEQEKGNPAYPKALGKALQVLDKSASPKELVEKLRELEKN